MAALGPKVRAWLNERNALGEAIGNSPAAVYALAAWQRGYTRMSPEKAASEVERLRGLDQYRMGNRSTLDRVALLRKVAARAQGRELPMPPKAAPVSPGAQARAKLEGEAQKIRQDPNYYGGDSRLRKVLVARMGEIMGELHGVS